MTMNLNSWDKNNFPKSERQKRGMDLMDTKSIGILEVRGKEVQR